MNRFRGMQCNEALFGVILLLVMGYNSRMAPVAAGFSRVLELGTAHGYTYATTVILNEAASAPGSDVGYRVVADVAVAVVWQSRSNNHDKLIEFQVNRPRLLIKSRKAPTPEGFVVHDSSLENLRNFPFVARWLDGIITDLYVDKGEEMSMVNLKRGISSLFQFQLLDTETKETDASGDCLVTYRTVEPHSFTKTKTDCTTAGQSRGRLDPAFAARINSTRTATYLFSRDLSYLESVTVEERHETRTVANRDFGGAVTAVQTLAFSGTKPKADAFKSRSAEEALKEYEERRKVSLRRTTSVVEAEDSFEQAPSLANLVKENRENLSAERLGSLRSATAFLKVLTAARIAGKEELAKAFRGIKNKEILAQLCDVAGAVQTAESHEVLMNILNFGSEDHLHNSERYLWALSVGQNPNGAVLKDLFSRSKTQTANDKLSETLLLTISAMAKKYHEKTGGADGLAKEIGRWIVSSLDKCEEEKCRHRYLRALKNLRCPRTIPTLVRFALTGSRKTSVAAMKALRSLDASLWTEEVIDAAQRIFFQAGRRYDSSARTLAADILLESDPPGHLLEEVVLSLADTRERAFEVRQYLGQRVAQISDKCGRFSERVAAVVRRHADLFRSYDVRAQRGLTTAFTRSVAGDGRRNVSLVSVQEVEGGFLKRGLVDVVVETPGATSSLFTLGLFAGGLSSFVSSAGREKDPDEEEESATAGMEISILGTQLRPFVFFDGQGELMGHVWSGTASEMTPAYQALIVTHDQSDLVVLQNGIVVRLNLLGVVSFDLSGQVQISIWNRNAHSLVEKNAGVDLRGRISADTSFVRCKVEYNLATEVKLNLQSDLSFYNEISLCMQLSQPEARIKHNVHKVERIPGSKHRLRKSRYREMVVPGRTYALNRKNNEMCNLIFQYK